METDDSRAAETVREIRRMLTGVASARGGRIFSSAGDGFMLEFDTASAGLEAALEALEAFKAQTPPIQVRIGVHTGEVIVEPGGDLLGHAVNIAARLQQRAAPDQVVLSEDVRRSARSALTRSLSSLGAVKLDKMDETIDVYALGQSASRRAPRIDRRLVLVAAVAILVATAAMVLAPRYSAPSPRIAVFALTAPPGSGLETLAQGITVEIVDTLSQIGLESFSASESTPGSDLSRRTSLSLNGEVNREGDTVRVSVRLRETASGRTLWAQNLRAARPAGNGTASAGRHDRGRRDRVRRRRAAPGSRSAIGARTSSSAQLCGLVDEGR